MITNMIIDRERVKNIFAELSGRLFVKEMFRF